MGLRKSLELAGASTPLTSIWKIPWVRQLRRRVRRPLQVAAAPVLINYIKFVISTSTVVSDPPDWLARVQALHPSIIALWHGNSCCSRASIRQ